MFKPRNLIVCLLIVSACLWFSCTKKEEATEVPTMVKETIKTVYVVNYPLKYFAERIASGKVKIVFPTPVDKDPAYWLPDSKTIHAYQNADLILLNGATYAKWAGKVTLPESKLIDTSKAFNDKYLQLKHAVTHSHGPGGIHAHTGTDFNTWVDPNLAIIQARAIKNALSKLVPSETTLFDTNLKALVNDLQNLDKTFKSVVSGNENIPVVASHPVYGYFAKAYNLNLKAMLWEPEEMPSDDEWKNLDKILKDHPAKWMIWEGNPSEENVAKLKEHGLNGVVFIPCGNVPDDGDYIKVMQKNAENLKAIYKGN